MRIGVYYRVSTDEQTFASQEQSVKEFITATFPTAEVVEYREKISGRSVSRKEYDRLVSDTERTDAGRLDAVVVYRLDRFGRSMNQVLKQVMRFEEIGCGFRSVTQPFINVGDTNPISKLIIAIFAAMAQVERETISARVKDGMRASPNRAGPKPRITKAMRDEIQAAAAAGQSVRQIAKTVHVSPSQVHVIIREAAVG